MTKKKSDTPMTKKKSDTPMTKKIITSKPDLVTKHNTESLPSDRCLNVAFSRVTSKIYPRNVNYEKSGTNQKNEKTRKK